MAPVEKRATMEATGSTSSMGTGGRTPVRRCMSPRNVASCADCSSTARVYSLNTSYRLDRVACWSLNTVFGLKRWISPSRRHWYSPPTSRSRWASSVGRSRWESRWRWATSSARTSSPTPPIRETVPVKYSSMTSGARPTASKTWAPVYDATVEMPILDITLMIPLEAALM